LTDHRFFYVPPAVHGDIREALDELQDEDRVMITDFPSGNLSVALDMSGFYLIPNPEDDRNLLINSAALVGVIEDLNRDAFIAGFRAAVGDRRTITSDRAAEAAWQTYFPSEALRASINNLFGDN